MRKVIYKKQKEVVGRTAYCIDCGWNELRTRYVKTGANAHSKATNGHRIDIGETTRQEIVAAKK